jgi:hypothetical protein
VTSDPWPGDRIYIHRFPAWRLDILVSCWSLQRTVSSLLLIYSEWSGGWPCARMEVGSIWSKSQETAILPDWGAGWSWIHLFPKWASICLPVQWLVWSRLEHKGFFLLRYWEHRLRRQAKVYIVPLWLPKWYWPSYPLSLIFLLGKLRNDNTYLPDTVKVNVMRCMPCLT